jgi:hypothetical protein
MDQQQHDEYVAKAKHAEEQAIVSMEQTTRESWLKIAASYTEMANFKGAWS